MEGVGAGFEAWVVSWKFEGLRRRIGKARVRFRVREAKSEGLGLE
jgi:hypothetical protein